MNGQLELAPVHTLDPASSREAAGKVKAGSQLHRVLGAIVLGGPEGVSNRDIQMVVCDGNPGHPLWNKVPTRCRTLETLGLVEQVTAAGTPVLRSHSSGGRFLVWRAV